LGELADRVVLPAPFTPDHQDHPAPPPGAAHRRFGAAQVASRLLAQHRSKASAVAHLVALCPSGEVAMMRLVASTPTSAVSSRVSSSSRRSSLIALRRRSRLDRPAAEFARVRASPRLRR